jgi:hypothetical protein
VNYVINSGQLQPEEDAGACQSIKICFDSHTSLRTERYLTFSGFLILAARQESRRPLPPKRSDFQTRATVKARMKPSN